MKIEYLFCTLLSAILLLAGCKEVSTESLDNIKLDKTYLSIPESGGTAKLTIDATEAWAFVTTETWPEESWLSVDKMSGDAGETVLTFSAEKTDAGRELELSIQAGNNLQFVRVRQGSMAAQTATCKDVIDGPEGKSFRVKGVCTSILKMDYGNWYLKDDTGEIYIYGTLDGEGKEKNFESLGIEVGDSVTVEGPKVTYVAADGSKTVELVNVTVVSHKKALVKLASEAYDMAKEGGELSVKLAYKGNGVFIEEMDPWISFVDMTHKKGEPSKLEPNPADTAIVNFKVEANTAADRKSQIKFSSYSGKNSSTVIYEFIQLGEVQNVTIEDFIAAEVDERAQYRVSGLVSNIEINAESQTADVTIYNPATKTELFVKGMKPSEENKIEDLGIKEDDYLTVVGKRGENEGKAQLVDGTYENRVTYNVVSIQDFLAAPVSETERYLVSGKISEIEEVSEQFGNATLTISDDSGNSLYIFRMKPEAKKKITDYGFAVGDALAVLGLRDEYKGEKQMGGGIVIAHGK